MSETDWKKVTEVRVGSKARVLVVDTRGAGSTGDDESAEFTDDSEVVQPLGLLARPKITKTLEALVLRTGDQDIVLALVDKGGDPISGLEEDEVRLHGLKERSAVIRIRANGDIEITPKAGRDVILAGGAAKVARVGDATAGHAHSVVFNLTAPPGGGTVTGSITVNSNTDTINAGADHVKA